ncbi:unnamed protein product [Rotaria sordida]|uniref:Uncharacterized protein n=1 Tax=Rotaria sordida TaxID=392033 RepID=A0A818QV83_9BILA|nr:unnamed protein product [Rotaria sordida]
MLNGQSHRKDSTRLPTGNANKTTSTGPSLEFRWSTAAIHRAAKNINRPPTPIPILTSARYPQRSHLISSSSLRTLHHCGSSDRSSTVSSSLSIQKSARRLLHLPTIRQITATKQNTSLLPKRTTVNRCPTPFRPLVLSYAQLHRPEQQRDKHQLSQHHTSVDQLTGVSIATSKLSSSSNPSLTSTVLPSLIEELHLPTNHLVRLHTPQLRRLNISDKYINEAKELYFDATSKVFLPRMPTMHAS